MSAPRKRTRWQTCERHRWLMRERPERRAEFFMEGGPAHDDGDGGCRGGECRLWPGKDLRFMDELCHGEFELDWTYVVHVGRTDGMGEVDHFVTLSEGVARIAELALSDPEGIDRGDYYLDSPEWMLAANDALAVAP